MQYVSTAGDWKPIDTDKAKNPLTIDADEKIYPKYKFFSQILSKIHIFTIATLALYIGLFLYI